jgi:hypothetical protein
MTEFSWRERRDSNPGTSRCLKYNGSERIIAIRGTYDGRKTEGGSRGNHRRSQQSGPAQIVTGHHSERIGNRISNQDNPTKEIQSV